MLCIMLCIMLSVMERTGARLTVREYANFEAIQRRLHKVRDLLVHLVLGGLTLEHVVKRENLHNLNNKFTVTKCIT